MNYKTAQYLNELFRRAKPVTILEGTECIRGGYLVNQSLLDELERLEQSGNDEMVRQEIVKAAIEHREACINAPDWVSGDKCDCYTWMGRPAIPWEATARRWAVVKPRIQAALDAHNAKTMAEYESYRIACEQGVAVPPQG